MNGHHTDPRELREIQLTPAQEFARMAARHWAQAAFSTKAKMGNRNGSDPGRNPLVPPGLRRNTSSSFVKIPHPSADLQVRSS
jgi:hypothetical protein